MFGRNKVVKEEKPVIYPTEYLGGLVMYPVKQDAKILIYKDRFVMTPMKNKLPAMVEVPYERMTHIETVIGEKRIDGDRVLVTGLLGLIWKKDRMVTTIKYIDKQGTEQKIITDFRDNVKYIQPKLYERMQAVNETK